MGYRVGYQCFTTKELAHDYILSQQAPVVTQDLKLLRPVKHGNEWYFNGQKVELSFPQCDIAEQVEHGILFGLPLILIAILIFGFNQIRRMIERLMSVGERDD